jgi:hypothetical protein
VYWFSENRNFAFERLEPTKRTDPSGLEDKKPIRVEFEKGDGVPAGYLYWSFKAPMLPADLNIYTARSA